MSESVKKLSDSARLKQAASLHGLAVLTAISLWAIGDIWSVQSSGMLPALVAVVSALFAGHVLAVLFHEWGHFAGARYANSYSPISPKIKDAFMFGFNFKKNTPDQFLSMSIGGPAGNWLLVVMVFFLIPNDSLAEVTLLAMVLAKAISVSLFEIPTISRVMDGGNPQAELDEALDSGSLDRAAVLGYAAGFVIWLVLI